MTTPEITAEVRSLLAEVACLEMNAAVTALSGLVARRVEMVSQQLDDVPWSQIDPAEFLGAVAVQAEYTAGLEGETMLLLREADAAGMVDLVLGGDSTAVRSVDREVLLTRIAEVADRMLSATASAMGESLGTVVGVSRPVARLLGEIDVAALISREGRVIRGTYVLRIEGLSDATFCRLWPSTWVSGLAPRVLPAALTAGGSGLRPTSPPTPAPAARPVQFGPLTPRGVRNGDRNIEVLFDVALQVTVELGRTRMRIRDVLALGPGAVIELDRLAGEPVDLFLNDRLFARGEVVVIEENFGVRITEILSQEARVQHLAGLGPVGATT